MPSPDDRAKNIKHSHCQCVTAARVVYIRKFHRRRGSFPDQPFPSMHHSSLMWFQPCRLRPSYEYASSIASVEQAWFVVVRRRVGVLFVACFHFAACITSFAVFPAWSTSRQTLADSSAHDSASTKTSSLPALSILRTASRGTVVGFNGACILSGVLCAG